MLAAARGGDRAALESLLRRQHPRIHAVCRRMLGSEVDADDAAQVALINLARNIGAYDGRAAVSTWTYRIAVNACLDELRRRRRRPQPVADVGPITTAQAAPDDEVAMRLTIDAALAGLRPEYRAALVLRDLCDLDYREIAEVLELPPGTVRSRIARARAALAAGLGNQPPVAERRNDTP